MKKALTLILIIFCFGIFFKPNTTHAMDRRVLVMFKSAGYGAAAGMLVGAATWTMGIGSTKNLFVGGSLGLYAGLIFGSYILFSQEDPAEKRRYENPYQPGKRIGPEDWKDEPEEPFSNDLRLMTPITLTANLSYENTVAVQPVYWMPVYQIQF